MTKELKEQKPEPTLEEIAQAIDTLVAAKVLKVSGWWHYERRDGKSWCNHRANRIGGECGHSDSGRWEPILEVSRSSALTEGLLGEILRGAA